MQLFKKIIKSIYDLFHIKKKDKSFKLNNIDFYPSPILKTL